MGGKMVKRVNKGTQKANVLFANTESMIPEIASIWFPKNVQMDGSHGKAYGIL
jgi:hypothetical protein